MYLYVLLFPIFVQNFFIMGLQRYDIYSGTGAFEGSAYGEEAANGEWVKWEDVEPLLKKIASLQDFYNMQISKIEREKESRL